LEEFQIIFVGYSLYARYIPDQKRVHRVVEQGIKLIQRCDLLFASARLLQEKENKAAGS